MPEDKLINPYKDDVENTSPDNEILENPYTYNYTDTGGKGYSSQGERFLTSQYDINLKAGIDQNLNRAKHQDGWDATGNAIARFGLNVAPLIVSQLSGIFVTKDDIKNQEGVALAITNAFEEIRANNNAMLPMYRENPGIALDLGDSAYWAETLGGLSESIASFLAVGAVTGGVLGAASKGLSSSTKLMQLGNAMKQSGKAGTAVAEFFAAANKPVTTIASAFALTESEGIVSSLGVYAEAYKYNTEVLGLDEEAARTRASNAAAATINTNRWNVLLNLSSAGMFVKGGTNTQSVLTREYLTKVRDNIGKGMTRDAAENAAKKSFKPEVLKKLAYESAQEFAEEEWNLIAEKYGSSVGQGKPNFDKAISAIFTKEGLEAGLLGALGGFAQTGAMLTYDAASGQNKKDEEARQDVFKQLAEFDKIIYDNDGHTLTSVFDSAEEQFKLAAEIKAAYAAGDEAKAQALSKKSLAFQAMNAFQTGTTEGLVGIYQALSNMSQEEAIAKGFITDIKDYAGFKTKALEAIKTINSLESHYLDAVQFVNPTEVYRNKISQDINLERIEYINKKISEKTAKLFNKNAILNKEMDLENAPEKEGREGQEIKLYREKKAQLIADQKKLEDEYDVLTSKETQATYKEPKENTPEAIKAKEEANDAKIKVAEEKVAETKKTIKETKKATVAAKAAEVKTNPKYPVGSKLDYNGESREIKYSDGTVVEVYTKDRKGIVKIKVSDIENPKSEGQPKVSTEQTQEVEEQPEPKEGDISGAIKKAEEDSDPNEAGAAFEASGGKPLKLTKKPKEEAPSNDKSFNPDALKGTSANPVDNVVANTAAANDEVWTMSWEFKERQSRNELLEKNKGEIAYGFDYELLNSPNGVVVGTELILSYVTEPFEGIVVSKEVDGKLVPISKLATKHIIITTNEKGEQVKEESVQYAENYKALVEKAKKGNLKVTVVNTKATLMNFNEIKGAAYNIRDVQKNNPLHFPNGQIVIGNNLDGRVVNSDGTENVQSTEFNGRHSITLISPTGNPVLSLLRDTPAGQITLDGKTLNKIVAERVANFIKERIDNFAKLTDGKYTKISEKELKKIQADFEKFKKENINDLIDLSRDVMGGEVFQMTLLFNADKGLIPALKTSRAAKAALITTTATITELVSKRFFNVNTILDSSPENSHLATNRLISEISALSEFGKEGQTYVDFLVDNKILTTEVSPKRAFSDKQIFFKVDSAVEVKSKIDTNIQTNIIESIEVIADTILPVQPTVQNKPKKERIFTIPKPAQQKESNNELLPEDKLIKIAEKLKTRFNVNFELINVEEANNILGEETTSLAFFKDNKVYFVKGRATSETPFHEFSHPFINAIYDNNRALFVNLKRQLTSDIIEYVKNKYPEYVVNGELTNDGYKEAVVTALGRYAANEIKDKGLISAIKKFLQRISDYIKSILGKDISVDELNPNISLQELSDLIVYGRSKINLEGRNTKLINVFSDFGIDIFNIEGDSNFNILKKVLNVNEENYDNDFVLISSKIINKFIQASPNYNHEKIQKAVETTEEFKKLISENKEIEEIYNYLASGNRIPMEEWIVYIKDYNKIKNKVLETYIEKKLKNTKVTKNETSNIISSFINNFKNIVSNNLTKEIDSIVNNIFTIGKEAIFNNKFLSGKDKVSFEKALEESTHSKNIIYTLSNTGAILTGSVSIAEQGTVFRKLGNLLHDIDWAIPTNAEISTEQVLRDSFPGTALVREFDSKDYYTKTFIVPPKNHVIKNLTFFKPEKHGRKYIAGYDTVNSNNEIISNYRRYYTENLNSGKVLEDKEVYNEGLPNVDEDLNSKSVDLFFNYKDLEYPTFEIELSDGKKIQMSNWMSSFTEKLKYGRAKDLQDWLNFIPNKDNQVKASNTIYFQKNDSNLITEIDINKKMLQMMDEGRLIIDCTLNG